MLKGNHYMFSHNVTRLKYWIALKKHIDINTYSQTSNIRTTLVSNKIVEHSDVVGASPVGAAPTTSSFWTWHMASVDWTKITAKQDENYSSFVIWCDLY